MLGSFHPLSFGFVVLLVYSTYGSIFDNGRPLPTSHSGACAAYGPWQVGMSFFLVDAESEFTLELSLSQQSEQDLRRQLAKLQEGGDAGTLSRRLAAELSRLVPEMLDWDVKRPTKAQIAYARSICYQRKIELPEQAMESRQAMHLFIASRGRWP